MSQGTDTAMRRPEETSRWFAQTADGILTQVALAEKSVGCDAGKEFRSTVTDLQDSRRPGPLPLARLLAGVSLQPL